MTQHLWPAGTLCVGPRPGMLYSLKAVPKTWSYVTDKAHRQLYTIQLLVYYVFF